MTTARLLLCATLAIAPLCAHAQRAATGAPQAPPARAIRLDSAGVVRWADDGSEVALFGANYAIMSASDFRAAGYLGLDRKKLVDVDMAHFARMGWDGLRIATWGDWENADSLGNLIENEHLDLIDYVVAKARERGIYMLLTPIQTYDAGWPDALHTSRSYPGFSRKYSRGDLGTKPEAIAAQVNYLKQVMSHVNRYTGIALRDDPFILFVEMINEPFHHPEDSALSVSYIDALHDAVRSTGSRQITFHNLSQDFAIANALRRSRVQGITFGWYPTGLNAGRELQGNHLRTVDLYDQMKMPDLQRKPRLVYEFDSADLLTGYMYPAMARAFRTGGVQFAAMFSYDMLGTSSRNLGWQTHYLNLAYTPRKAMSAVIAAEAMRRLPRGRSYGEYPANTRFGDFRVSYEENLGELVSRDAFLYTSTTRSTPPRPASLRRVAGTGSSSVVTYDGMGAYFLDKVRDGVWRLEVYPDAVPVRDPFAMPSPDKVVTRAIYRSWPMRIALPDLGASFTVQRIAGPAVADSGTRAVAGRFSVTPGVYVLGARGPVVRQSLPATIGRLRFDEFHPPAPDTLGLRVQVEAQEQYASGLPLEIAARVVDATPPDSVTLWIRQQGVGRFRPYPMRPAGAYDYRATIPAADLREAVYEYAISAASAGRTVTFPEATSRRPSDWDWSGERFWRTSVVPASAPVRLFTPSEDVRRLTFTRIGDNVREGIFRIVPSAVTGQDAFHLELPVFGTTSPDDYTVSLYVGDRIAARGDQLTAAGQLTLRMRGLGARQALHVTLVEKDGTSWSSALVVDSAFAERSIPLAQLGVARGVKLPLGYPGRWNYWMGPAAGRGGPGDAIRIRDVERLQLSLRAENGVRVVPGGYGVEVESVTLQQR